MPRVSIKENKNLYFQKREALGLTREAAGNLLEAIPPERIEKIENERVVPHPEEVLIIAEKYKSPEICNYYCSNQCPVGQQYVPEIKVKDLSQIVLEMVSSLNATHKSQERLIDIAADCQINNDEIDDFIAIRKDLEKISIAVETLQLWTEQMLENGSIDRKAYEARLNK